MATKPQGKEVVDEPAEDYTQTINYIINVAGNIELTFNGEVHNVKMNSGKPQPFPPPHT